MAKAYFSLPRINTGNYKRGLPVFYSLNAFLKRQSFFQTVGLGITK